MDKEEMIFLGACSLTGAHANPESAVRAAKAIWEAVWESRTDPHKSMLKTIQPSDPAEDLIAERMHAKFLKKKIELLESQLKGLSKTPLA
jgi:hypothetical protein